MSYRLTVLSCPFYGVTPSRPRHPGAALVPHCPCFGPGLLATLHLLAAAEVEESLDYYFADLAAPPPTRR